MSHTNPSHSVNASQSLRSAKGNFSFGLQCLIALAATLAVCGASASEIEKANNADDLDLTTSWVGGVLAGPGDIATWNSTVAGANATSLGTNTAWLGIKITNPGGPVQINPDGNTLTNGAVNAVGNVGVDMSAATQDLTLSNNLVISGVQDWKIAAGRTLRLGGNLARNEGGVIRFSLADATSFVIITNGSDVVVANGTPNAMLGGTYGNNYFGTINDTDYAALINAAGGGFQVVNGSTLGLYSANGSGNTDPGNVNVIDFVTDDPSAFGQRASNTRTWLGLRFNIPQANNLFVYNGMNAWEINIPSGRTVTCNNILITTNVGPSPVVFTQNVTPIGNLRIGNGGAQDLLIYQNNPAAPLVIAPNINLAQQGTGRLVKMGVGTMIVQSPNVNYTGGTKIYGGTLLSDSAAGVGVGALDVFGGTFAQSSLSANRAPTTIYTGATNGVMINAANGSSADNSNVTFYAGSRLQFVYSNSIVPSATVPALLVTNLSNALVASNAVVVDVVCGQLSVGQFPLISYAGAIGGDGGGAFTLGTLEPHASGYISNNVTDQTIDLVVTNITQPLTWAVGDGVWDTSTSNWKNTLGATTTYQEIGLLGDNVIFDDSSPGTSPITVTVSSTVIPGSVTVNDPTKNYVISGGGSINGLGSFTKTGAGSLTLSTTNGFTGGLNLNGGVLVFNSLTNLGLAGINFGGGTLKYSPGTVDDISVRAVTFKSGGGTIDDGGNTLSFAKPIGNNGAGGLTKAGAGTLTLNGTNHYSGDTVVAQGTLEFGASTFIPDSSVIMVNSGAMLDAATSGVGLALNGSVQQKLAGSGTVNGEITSAASTSISPGTNGVVGTLALAGDLTMNGGTLAMDVSSGSRDLVTVSGNLTLTSGTLQLNVTGTLPNGTYKLIQYGGTLVSGSGSSGNLTLTGFSQPGQTAFLIDSTPGEIDLSVSTAASDNLTWSSGGSSWDLSGTKDWLNGVNAWAFTNGDAVTFDDSGAPTVNLQAALRPGSVTVNNTVAYTFADGTGTGGGKLSGPAGITKSGTGTLTIQTANNNNGPTVINAGTVQVGNGGIGDIGLGNVTNNGALVFGQGDNAQHNVPGVISGSGSVTENGSATVVLQQNNTYSGPTTITSGTLQVGSGGASGTLGSNLSVTNDGALVFDRSGSLAVANNITGSGSLALIGPATVTFTGSLGYQGNTSVSNGVVKLTAADQIPDANSVSGSTGLLGLAGRLDLGGFNETVNGLTDLGVNTGDITNSAASGTNVLTVGTALGLGTNTYTGAITEKANGAHIALVLIGPGNETLGNTNNNYSGGTFVGEGAQLTLGTAGSGGVPGNVAAGTGRITMSNNTTLYMNGNVITFPPNPVTIAPGASVSFSSQSLGDQYSGLISGDATGTNVIAGPWTSAGAGQMWNGFLGTVLIPTGGQLRVFGTPGGGTNATFDMEGTGQLFTRTTESVYIGKLVGTGSVGFDTSGNPLAGGITGPNVAGSTGNFIIGTANADSTYGGTISGANNVYKAGAGKLTLDGSTNTFMESIDGITGLIDTNYFMTNGLSYVGATVVSNGVLAIVAPANLNGTNFLSFTLASSSATLDLSSAGSTPDGVTLVTNSTLQLGNGQTLTGIGTINGGLIASNGSTVSAGLPGNTNGTPVTGALNITGTAELAGSVVLNICTTNSPNSGEIVAPNFTIDPTATLTVTNLGPESGGTFHLFSKAVSGFASVTLPPVTGTNSWINNLGTDGTITLVAPPLVNTTPTNILFSISGGNLTLSWPADHTGWTLQAQTNPPGAGIGTNWVNVTGSAGTDSMSAPLNGTNNVFFRLTYP